MAFVSRSLRPQRQGRHSCRPFCIQLSPWIASGKAASNFHAGCKKELPLAGIILEGRRDQLPAIVKAPMEELMVPMDYFMAIFAGICIGFAGTAYVFH